LNETKQPGAAGEWRSEPDDLLDIAVGLPHTEIKQRSADEESVSHPQEANGVLPSILSSDVGSTKGSERAVEEAVAEKNIEDAPGLEVPLTDILTVDLMPKESNAVDSSIAEDGDGQRPLLLLTTSQSMSSARSMDGGENPYYETYEPVPSAAVEEEPQENWFALLFKETLETVVLAVVIFLLIRVAIQNYRIEGSSMEPNFHNGEYLLVNKLAYRLGEYERGDVIVFKYPGDTTKDYIKRVIGLPGDTVEIRDGMLYVNEQLVPEPYEVMPMNYLTEMPRVVEPGTLYVMGDNRPASSDTRDWGLLDQDLVIGQAWLAIYPFDTFGLVDHPDLHFTPGMAQGP
jgi:signal peptidase I